MDCEISYVGPHKTIVETFKGKTIISDTTIQSKVGNATYRLLYFRSPELYAKFYTCNRACWKDTFRYGTGSMVGDLPTFFMDCDYTERDLKMDLVRIIIGVDPINEEARRLIGSSIYDESECMSGWGWIIMIAIIVIICTAVTWFVLNMYYNMRMDICLRERRRFQDCWCE